MRESFGSHFLTEDMSRFALMGPNFADEGKVIQWVNDNRYIIMVFCSGADHRRAANINIFDTARKITTTFYGFLEGI